MEMVDQTLRIEIFLAVIQRYGPSHLAFITVPLVGTFFIDLVNAVVIPLFL
jgi:ESS family glutamate:Na+ symporter